MQRASHFPVAARQLDLFVSVGGDIAARDAQDLMAWPFFSLAKTKRVRPIDFRMGEVSILVEATAEHGMATIWDADVLIWVASQIVEARDSGRATSRLTARSIVPKCKPCNKSSGPASSPSNWMSGNFVK